jgi:hypothetical protein
LNERIIISYIIILLIIIRNKSIKNEKSANLIMKYDKKDILDNTH